MSKASHLRQRAQDFLKKGKLDKAIEEYKKLVQVESRNPNIYNELGDLFLKAQDRVQAVSYFEKASINYEKVALYNNAVAVCKKILRVAPNRLATIFKLGELKAKQKFESEAAAHFMQYLRGVLTDSATPSNGVSEKLDLMIEYMSDREEILGAVAEAYGRLGFRAKAAGLFADLVSRLEEEGEAQRAEAYRNAIESMKSSMSSDELAKFGKRMSKTAEGTEKVGHDFQSAVDEVFGESETSVVVDEKGAGTAPGTDGSADGSTGIVEETKDAQRSRSTVSSDTSSPVAEKPPSAPVTGGAARGSGDEVPGGSARDSAAATAPHAAAPADGTVETHGSAAVEVAVEEDALAREEVVVQPVPEEPVERKPEEGSGFEAAGVSGDEEAKDFAREITSDVEEDDYRSHYDLGMAYIEMALFDEAVKELQIASRSDQLRLRSIEMIGHCFLMQSNPRLAVKQLQRGLAKAEEAGVESLGIHYNLGLAYEMLGEMDKAREYFEEVYIVDVTFRDIAAKMKKYSATQ